MSKARLQILLALLFPIFWGTFLFYLAFMLFISRKYKAKFVHYSTAIIVPIFVWVKAKQLSKLDTIKTYDEKAFMLRPK